MHKFRHCIVNGTLHNFTPSEGPESCSRSDTLPPPAPSTFRSPRVLSAAVRPQVKLWDVSSQQPALIATQDLQVGAVFGAAFCPEVPWLLAAVGAMGTVAVWDITTNPAVMSKYGHKLSRAVAAEAMTRSRCGS